MLVRQKTIDVDNKNLKQLITFSKKLLFTMENAAAADSSQSNISRLYILKTSVKLVLIVFKKLCYSTVKN